MRVKLYWKTKTPIQSFIPGLRRRSAERTRDIALRVWNGAVDRTPVYSGELRASWNITEGSPNYSTVGDPSKASNSAIAPLPKPAQPVLPVKVKLFGAKYFVVNGKRYATNVEYGSPTAPPTYMLARAVRAAVR